MAIAPPAVLKADQYLKNHPKRPKSYRFSGSVGDSNHGYGYHLSPNNLPGSDYSLQTARDKAGAKKHPNMASAWDLSFGPGDMKLVTKRLFKAAKAGDSRLKGLREFCGTVNGWQTYPWDLHDNASEGVGSWDNSHLWHVHLSLYRDTVNDDQTLRNIVDVICGVPAPARKPAAKPKFPLARSTWFSAKRNARHTGVLAIQRRLQTLGFAPKNSGWADGFYGPETAVSVNAFKKSHGLHGISGAVGYPTWTRLFK